MRPPFAHRISQTLEMHGHQRDDPYFWLRDRDNPAVLEYLKEENAYTQHVMEPTEGLQKTLFEEIKGRMQARDSSIPSFKNGYWYYARYDEGYEHTIYVRHHLSLDAPEEVFLDLNILADGQAFCDVADWSISDDNRYLAYALNTDGGRIYTIYFVDLTTKETLAEKLTVCSGNLTWASKSHVLFFTGLNRVLRAHKVFRYQLHSNTAAEEVYFEKNAQFDVGVGLSKSERYLFISCFSTLSSETLWIPSEEPYSEFKRFYPRQKNLEYAVEHAGDTFYILTNWDAPNFRLMSCPIEQTDRSNWTDILAPKAEVLLEDFEVFKDFIVCEERSEGNMSLRVLDLRQNQSHVIPFDEAVFSSGVGYNPDFDTVECRIVYSSMTCPTQTWQYNLLTRERVLLKEQRVPDPNFSADDYQSKRLFVTADDGARIPISMVYRKGRLEAGPGPCLIYGYGAYGYSTDPYFSISRISLMDRGFIFVLAHVRGGEEMGRSWYEAGKFFNKQNSFSDFIACAKALVDQGYARVDTLVAMGGSAGGLLVCAAVNQAPECFGAVVAEVPFVDVVTTMLDEEIPLTCSEYEEWGNPNDLDYYRYMLTYSPYDNIKAQAYPPMLITGGWKDTQVPYWEPAKWVAKLRYTKTNEQLILLKTDLDLGHSGASGRYESIVETAFEYAFIIALFSNDPIHSLKI